MAALSEKPDISYLPRYALIPSNSTDIRYSPDGRDDIRFPAYSRVTKAPKMIATR